MLLLGICFRARRTGDGQSADGHRGVRGSGNGHVAPCSCGWRRSDVVAQIGQAHLREVGKSLFELCVERSAPQRVILVESQFHQAEEKVRGDQREEEDVSYELANRRREIEHGDLLE